MFYPIQNIYDADLVIVKDNKTYLCYLDPSSLKHPCIGDPGVSESNTLKADVGMNCWRIVQIETKNTNGSNTIYGNDINTIIERKYPFGDPYNYKYTPTKIAEYEFCFRR